MIAEILPPGVAAAESFGPPRRCGLFPAEAAAVATADWPRRGEFAAARAVARVALARLGAPAGPLLPGRAGEPRWPDGVVGSLTHCAGYRACAVALTRDMVAVGIDAEPSLTLADGLLEAVASDTERGWLAELSAASGGMPWGRILFCAKESVYKAWFPATGQRLGFQDVTVQISTAGKFAVRMGPGCGAGHTSGISAATAVPGSASLASLTGRWLVRGGLIVTAVTVPAPP